MKLHTRLVKAEFWTDSKLLSQCTLEEQIAFQSLWFITEDSGCVEDDPFAWKVLVFPSREQITTDLLTCWRDKFVQLGLVIAYQVNGKAYLFVTNFHKYQPLRNAAAPQVPVFEAITFEASENPRRGGKYIVDETVLSLYCHCSVTVRKGTGTGTGTGTGKGGGPGEGSGCARCERPCKTLTGLHGFFQFAHDEYRCVHHICPTIREGRDGNLISPILKQHGDELVRAAYRRYVRSDDTFIAEKAWPLTLFASQFDAWRSEKAGRSARQQTMDAIHELVAEGEQEVQEV